jgi:hypothetical protein
MNGILGVKPTSESDLPPGAPRGRDAERILAGELLQVLRHMSETMTEWAERYAGQVVNHVLAVEKVTFDAAATPISRQWHVPAGCIEVTNPSTHVITVVSGGGGGMLSAPTAGVGVYDVPAGTTRVVSLASRQVTLFGTAADTCSFQVFTAAARPGAV